MQKKELPFFQKLEYAKQILLKVKENKSPILTVRQKINHIGMKLYETNTEMQIQERVFNRLLDYYNDNLAVFEEEYKLKQKESQLQGMIKNYKTHTAQNERIVFQMSHCEDELRTLVSKEIKQYLLLQSQREKIVLQENNFILPKGIEMKQIDSQPPSLNYQKLAQDLINKKQKRRNQFIARQHQMSPY